MVADYKKELDSLIEYVIKEGGSDLHLSEGHQPTIRVAGFLVPLVNKPKLTAADTKGFLDDLLSPADRELFIHEKEIDFSYSYKNEARFRGNGFFQQGTVSIALRLIPKKIKSFVELNLPPILETFAQKHQGFFLVVGPIGHGKTTTLAAMVEYINSSRAEHIVTIEDPIEYVYEQKMSIVDQREVRLDTKDFHRALGSVFREDVNVLMIGDLRDMGAIKLVDNVLDETVDLGTYSETLKETLLTINRLTLQAEVELQEGEYIKCLSTIQKIGRLL
jgi:twitching motility protein PilT